MRVEVTGLVAEVNARLDCSRNRNRGGQNERGSCDPASSENGGMNPLMSVSGDGTGAPIHEVVTIISSLAPSSRIFSAAELGLGWIFSTRSR